VTLALRIAGALAAAHAAGIVHRDLKPQNIVLMPDGRPKLLDFGIAQAQLPPDVVANIETHTSTETVRSGALVGTPAYMSPEQVLRKTIDGRSDLFALGAVLYECLSGQPAFLTATDVETWGRVVYVTPAPPSSINRAVKPPLDAVVAKLLAKDPADRYASADAAAVALRALGLAKVDRKLSRRQLVLIAAAVIGAVALTGFTAWRLTRPRSLPPAPPEAARWYEKGTEFLRDGAYYSAERALKQALTLFEDYPQALARLAEAQTALDEEGDATASVVRISQIVPDTSRITGVDGFRLAAVRALVLRDLSRAIPEYDRITRLTPGDRGAWLDLARAYYEAYRRPDALAAADRALQIDSQYAAAHLRRALILADLRRGGDATREFEEAERLYRAASNSEGQAEALYEHARFLNGRGAVKEARPLADQAQMFAERSDNRLQHIRIALLTSKITFVMGDFDGAKRMATEAIAEARRNQLEVVAVEGQIEYATVLMYSGQNDEAATQLKEAIDLSGRLEAKSVKTRASLQLGSVFANNGQPRDAIAMANGVLDFVRRTQYKYMELSALDILARAREQLGEYVEAQRLAHDMLATAESLNDDAQKANALENLAGTAAALGSLPEALAFRARLEGFHDKQDAILSYDFANRAELLIRLGRIDETNDPLDRIDAGVIARNSGFMGMARRATMLRAMAATERQDFVGAERFSGRVVSESVLSHKQDISSAFAAALLANAAARLGHPNVMLEFGALNSRPDRLRELNYWRAVALLARRDYAGAQRLVDGALTDIKRTPSTEYEWRMAAIGSQAARKIGDLASAQTMRERARAALQRLRDAWKTDAVPYEHRADLMDRKREAGID
jgi:tetratricopeptide (TPR) repeat protein